MMTPATRDRIIDTNMAERIDFVNHKTGDWSFYYHYDDATAINPSIARHTTGLPTLPGFPITEPSRNQLFVMSNTKTIGATTVNVARIQFFRNSVHTAEPSTGSAFRRTLSMGLIPIPPTVAWSTAAPRDILHPCRPFTSTTLPSVTTG